MARIPKEYLRYFAVLGADDNANKGKSKPDPSENPSELMNKVDICSHVECRNDTGGSCQICGKQLCFLHLGFDFNCYRTRVL